MVYPLMPKAVAAWLVDNTKLTFEQIANFCGLHLLEVQGIADREVDKSPLAMDPRYSGQLTAEEISRCEADLNANLCLAKGMVNAVLAEQEKSRKRGKYTPVVRRQDKPNAIAWLLKVCPELADAQIQKLIGTTKSTIESVRNKTHWNYPNMKPKDPVLLGLCLQSNLNYILELARSKKSAEEERGVNEEG